MTEKPEIFCAMIGANKKIDGTKISSASRLRYVVENKTEALRIYSEMCKELDQFKNDEWTSGIAKLFHPVILPGGYYTTYSNEENICEYRFGYQETEQKESSDEVAVIKKPKTSVQRSNKKRNF